MKSYDTILFDLDGTLTDPALGITNSIAYALRKMEVEVPDRKRLTRFIGPPLMETFQSDFGFSPEEAALALRHYRAYFVEKGMLENHLYDGIGELLAELKTSGKTLAVATSKPEPFAVKILEHFGIADCFAYIAGGTLDETRTKKAEVIRYALEMLGISPGLSVVMVGDRKYDIIGAREVGITSIGVLYGYGTRDELSEAGALLLAEDIGKLGTLLMPERALEA